MSIQLDNPTGSSGAYRVPRASRSERYGPLVWSFVFKVDLRIDLLREATQSFRIAITQNRDSRIKACNEVRDQFSNPSLVVVGVFCTMNANDCVRKDLGQ
jgi:hypothetical protein